MNQDRGRRADAQRAGYDSLAWDEAVNAGRRWCHRCQAFEPVADFGRDVSASALKHLKPRGDTRAKTITEDVA